MKKKEKELLNKIEELEKRIELLEFHKEANGEFFVITRIRPVLSFEKWIRIKWLYDGKIYAEDVGDNGALGCRVKIQGKYIELRYRMSDTIAEVYTTQEDKLVKIDTDLYIKATKVDDETEVLKEEKKNDD
jgi:hypothetical protein